ncbi:MAG: GntR family transcriptional regulator [Firmicutes bacterium]|nr:GntR family transcriptional regulator [Bacillota bacterium]
MIPFIVEINTQSAIPIYEQLRNQIVLGIAANKLAPGEALPSVRGLAADLGINYLTVNKAYTMLCDEGYIVIDRRRGALVAKAAENDEAVLSKLSEQLTLTAAEAVCRSMSMTDFVSLCVDSYENAKGNPKIIRGTI